MKKALAVAGITALLGVTLSGCTGVHTEGWASSDLYAVAQVDGKSLLIAVDSSAGTLDVASDLSRIGVHEPTSNRVLYSPEGNVLAWNADNGPMRFASLDRERGRVALIDYTVDSGLSTLHDGSLYSVVNSPSAGASIEKFSLSSSKIVDRIPIDYVPSDLVSEDSGVAIVGPVDNWTSSVVQRISDDGELGTPITIPFAGAVGDMVADAGALVLTLGTAVTRGAVVDVPPRVVTVDGTGEVLSSPNAVNSRHLAAMGQGNIAIEETAGALTSIRLVSADFATVGAATDVVSTVPVQGMATGRSGRLAVLLQSGVTFIDAGSEASTYQRFPRVSQTSW